MPVNSVERTAASTRAGGNPSAHSFCAHLGRSTRSLDRQNMVPAYDLPRRGSKHSEAPLLDHATAAGCTNRVPEPKISILADSRTRPVGQDVNNAFAFLVVAGGARGIVSVYPHSGYTSR